jgi:glycosyltransferase involved in cell wall biosynthesis
MDYLDSVFSQYDVYFLATQPGTWILDALFHENQAVRQSDVEGLFEHDWAFAFFVGFKLNALTRQITGRVPSFCLTDTHPHIDVPDGIFRGILSHRVANLREDILLCAGSYNSDIFHKDRQGEDFVLSVGRIHPDKNQLELVSQYKERIYDRYGLPLCLVGGVDSVPYFAEICRYIDGISVRSTIESETPDTADGWLGAQEIAALLNRARLFVTASPKESFGIAVVEALACGTTCVLNGSFWGFDTEDLRPNVYGSIAEKRGSIVDLLEEALARNIRIDGSEWVKKFSLQRTAKLQIDFIEQRLR